MRAAVYDRYTTDATELEVREIDAPHPGPGQALIKVHAAGVNPVDWKAMAGYIDGLFPGIFPIVPGWDVAGTVVALGTDTPEFQVGDEVLGYARKHVLSGGTFAEYVTVDSVSLTHKPASLSWETAGALPLAGGTALRTIEALGDIDGKTVLIHAVAGGVGSLAAQIAVARGARVIGTASESNHDFVRSLGAEPITYGDGLAERVIALAGGPVDAVADFVGGQRETTVAVLREGGVHASIADGQAVEEYGGRAIWVRPDGAVTAQLAALVDEGTLRVEIAQTFGLDEVADAFALSRAGHTRGKLVVIP